MAFQVDQTEKRFADEMWQDYLNEIGRKIVRVCDRTDITYRFTVIESDDVNAFAAPGGFIYFYTGLLREMDTEAEMAAVLAHEISHVVARHGIKRLQASLGVVTAYQLVFGEDASEATNIAIGIGMNLLFAGYSRENEREADNFGLHYMVKAGYHPSGMEGMLSKLAALGDGGKAGVFETLSRSHPETQERIANTRKQAASMTPIPAGLGDGRDRYLQMKKRLPAPSEPGQTEG
jgi:predicted Zn-dependent protease